MAVCVLRNQCLHNPLDVVDWARNAVEPTAAMMATCAAVRSIFVAYKFNDPGETSASKSWMNSCSWSMHCFSRWGFVFLTR